MIIRGRAVIISISIIVFLAVAGHYLVAGYYERLPILIDELEPSFPTVAPGGPGLMPDPAPDAYTESIKDFFNEHRLEREKQRSMQVELLREIINNVNTSDDLRQQAQRSWLILTTRLENELAVEKLVIAKGYQDALLLLSDDTAHLLIKTNGLDQAQAVQLIELVASTLKIPAEDVRLVERQ